MPDVFSDPAYMPVHILAREIRQGRLSPVDIVNALLARIDRLDPGGIGAFISVHGREAREAAEGAARVIRSGHAAGPLHGIPIALKDLIEIDGYRTTGGSLTRTDTVSTRSAAVATRLFQAGMIVLGKTHTVEFALGGWGTNTTMGTPRNPWDPAEHRVAGGSSSGSAAAVAARLAPVAIGTDTGGSIRVPAGYCGVTGLKPTRQSVDLAGILPLAPTLDSAGPITRSVEDAALVFDAIRDADAILVDHRRGAPGPATRDLKQGIAGMRLARMPETERAGVDGGILAAYDRALDTLEELGAAVDTIVLPFSFEDSAISSFRIIVSEAYACYGALADDDRTPLDPHVRARMLPGRGILARDYIAALEEARAMAHAFMTAMDGFDALLLPTTETTAPKVADIDQSKAPGRFTRFANMLGLCALAVPNGIMADGMPSSLQIVGRPFDENLILRIGWAFEQATDWHAKAPPMATIQKKR